MSLILSYDSCNIGKSEKEKDVLRMKYFVVMTSKRQLYPMYGGEKKLGKFRTVSTSGALKLHKKIVTGSSNLLTPGPSRPGGTPESGPVSGQSSVSVRALMGTTGPSSRETTPDQDLEGTSIKSHILGMRAEEGASWSIQFKLKQSDRRQSSLLEQSKLSGIRQESVNYVGYFSQHEETMKSVIQGQAGAGEEAVIRVVTGAMVDCRRDSLWQKLLQDTDPGHVSPHVSLSHVEFLELISLVHHETLDKFDARLAPFLQKRPAWYLGLARVLQNKYGQFCRQFSSEDGQVQHTVVLHETNLSMFALLSVDREEGNLAIVHRESVPGGGYRSGHHMLGSLHSLLEGFVEACTFHAWSLLL